MISWLWPGAEFHIKSFLLGGLWLSQKMSRVYVENFHKMADGSPRKRCVSYSPAWRNRRLRAGGTWMIWFLMPFYKKRKGNNKNYITWNPHETKKNLKGKEVLRNYEGL